jgi:hypothetical protein
MEEYKGWPCYEEIPEGWWIDKNAGSPLHGYEFIINGSSLKGGERALVRVYKPALRVCTPELDTGKPEEKKTEESKPVQVIDENYTRTVNELARKKFEQKLLADIRVDLMVCEIEGWNKLEYLEELKSLINGLGSSSNGMANNGFNLTQRSSAG